ncbi:hypothetical protein SEVIR_6G005501v4 [Setaria viridis]|uniref:Uncharacterized protein n=1 Tax=Setaria viridis TaxID=4556 RepID=A0A4U6U029_SETVI|nr:hypothetical protein SEVIR_6G005501v2 [Setaria viridis]
MLWIVIPNGSFCTIGDTGAFFNRIPSLPDNVTCLGATDSWLALDCTDDVFRRTNLWDTYRDGEFLEPRSDVKHEHNYTTPSTKRPCRSPSSTPSPAMSTRRSRSARCSCAPLVLMTSSPSPPTTTTAPSSCASLPSIQRKTLQVVLVLHQLQNVEMLNIMQTHYGKCRTDILNYSLTMRYSYKEIFD